MFALLAVTLGCFWFLRLRVCFVICSFNIVILFFITLIYGGWVIVGSRGVGFGFAGLICGILGWNLPVFGVRIFGVFSVSRLFRDG